MLVGSPKAAEPWLAARRGRDRQGAATPPTGPASARGWSRSSACARSTASSSAGGPGKEEGTVGSLILGLYENGEEDLRVDRPHLGASRRRRSASWRDKLAPYETGERGSGDPSRWDADRELEWISLRPELVIEVSFDHVERRPHPPRREAPALARRQGAEGLRLRAARVTRAFNKLRINMEAAWTSSAP